MIKKTYHLRLATPAFLGDADQHGAWRTPPLKALIREWWRIAVAPGLRYDPHALKQHETALFGTAADEAGGDNRRSRIRLALAHWNEGTLTDWSKVNPAINGKPGQDPKVRHNEVDFDGGMVGSQLYLGYGPLIPEKGNPNTRLKKNAALQADETNQLRLALPETDLAALARAITLAHWFGTVGGRSRNGWGSLLWTAADGTPALPALSRAALENSGCTRALRDCLALDWPHAIGSDGKGVLVWHSSEAFKDWRDAMKFLAKTKIGFRTQPALEFKNGRPHPSEKKRKNDWQLHPAPEQRHVLAYPVTHHEVGLQTRRNSGNPDWGQDARLANTLRFKLRLEPDGRLRALIYHTPCKPTLPHAGLDLLDTWQRVHRFLDNEKETGLTRLA
ncbi:hypothetical protein MX652_13780 [Thauera aromatica]|nr:hypothetical protein [Thauera aromatica]MCK2127756.1 hypothetical protein [Thauera aromatica]